MTTDRLHSRYLVLFVLLLLTAQSVCFASSRKWIELRSSHFVVVTNASEHEARQTAEQFETIRGVFQKYFRTASINDRPLIIIAASDENTFRPLLPEAWTRKGAARRSGIYLNGPDKSYIALQIDQPYEIIYHEYIHYLLRHMNAKLPTWLVEGLAEFYANVRIESKEVLVGAPSASNLRILSQRTPLPLTALFEVTASSPYYNEENKISIFYAESWALTHYLMARDWHENTQRLSDFIGLLGPNVSQVDAARKSIGDPAVLKTALDEYVRKFTFAAARLDKPQIGQGDFRVQPLSDAESLALRADFMTHEGQYVKAQRALEEALKLDPQLAAAYENMAFLYFQQNKKADAETWSKQAVALNPEGYLANYYYGASLLREPLPKEWTVAAAETSLRTAIKSNPEFAPAYDALAFCLARPGAHQNLDEAHQMALAAVKRDPSDVGHRVRVVEVLLAMGRQDDAINEATRAMSIAKTPMDESAAAGALEAAHKFQVPQKRVKELQEAQASPAPSSSPIEVLTDTMGVDFKPYLDPLLKTVQQHWYQLIPESASTKHGTVSVQFAVMTDGSIAGLQVVQSSGDVMLDRPAYGSITASKPFAPLPTEFKGPYLGLRFSFYYNVTPKPRNSSITPPIEDVQTKLQENLSKDNNAKTDLEHDVAALTKLLETANLDVTDDAAARYFRARAQTLLNVLRNKDGLTPDKAANEQFLSDLDRIIARKTYITTWGITTSDIAYTAGTIAWNGLHSSRAYSYWQLCVDTVPCMFKLASGYTVGWEGVSPDPAKALELDLKAFDTDTKLYGCTGAYAAQNIAELIYFGGASYPKDNDPVSWIKKSYVLSDSIEAQRNSQNECDGAGTRMDEFLYRLAQGDRRNNLLTEAVQRFGEQATTAPALAKYFSGSLDANAFQKAVESSKSEFGCCYAYFHAMWYAYLIGDASLVDKFYEALSKFDQASCANYLVYARKFHPEATRSQSNPPQHSQ